MLILGSTRKMGLMVILGELKNVIEMNSFALLFVCFPQIYTGSHTQTKTRTHIHTHSGKFLFALVDRVDLEWS